MSQQRSEPAPRPPGVLIADDDEAICFSLSRALRRQGMTVYVAADGRAALDLFLARAGDIDVAFLDVRMPRMDGLETLAAMRRIAPNVASASSRPSGRRRLVRRGPRPFWESPSTLRCFVRS